MNNEGSAAQAAMAKHHNYMSFGKKQRYIEVFQCSGEDMHLVLTGGGAASGALSPVAAKALLSPPGMLPAQPLMTTNQVANPGTPVPTLMPAWDPMSVYAQNLAQTLALQRAAVAAAQQQQQQQHHQNMQHQQPQSQQSSPVPKLHVFGSSSVSIESSATVNTSTDSSAATMTTVTDDTENEDNFDNPVSQTRI